MSSALVCFSGIAMTPHNHLKHNWVNEKDQAQISTCMQHSPYSCKLSIVSVGNDEAVKMEVLNNPSPPSALFAHMYGICHL